jgi:hypothetical protein
METFSNELCVAKGPSNFFKVDIELDLDALFLEKRHLDLERMCVLRSFSGAEQAQEASGNEARQKNEQKTDNWSVR